MKNNDAYDAAKAKLQQAQKDWDDACGAEAYKNDYVFNEEESVRWNREEVVRRNNALAEKKKQCFAARVEETKNFLEAAVQLFAQDEIPEETARVVVEKACTNCYLGTTTANYDEIGSENLPIAVFEKTVQDMLPLVYSVLAANKISSFEGKYDFLSNFYTIENGICYEGLEYMNSEAAYQACKCLGHDEKALFMKVAAGKAKRMGRKVTMRSDWEDIKVKKMTEIIDRKFNIAPLGEMLLATGNKELIEGNTWHDNFWGVCSCWACKSKGADGRNMLGKILMAKRAALRVEVDSSTGQESAKP